MAPPGEVVSVTILQGNLDLFMNLSSVRRVKKTPGAQVQAFEAPSSLLTHCAFAVVKVPSGLWLSRLAMGTCPLSFKLSPAR